jgi:hypothetical protein
LIRTLLEATRKLQRHLDKRNIAFYGLVFLRNDIYEHLVRETPDRDKDTAISLDWDDREVFRQIVLQRIIATGELTGSFTDVWHALFDAYVDTEESFNFIVKRTLMRPRDLLKFVHKATEVAINRGHERVTSDDLRQAEAAYSEDMLVGMNFELGDVNPALIDAVYQFIGCPAVLDEGNVRQRLLDGGILPDDIRSSLELLLWFGFLGVQTAEREAQPFYSYEVNYNLAKLLAALKSDRGRIVVHPAFRSALGCG